MTLTRGDLKAKILRLLNKLGTTTGFYTDDKLNDAIEECFDYVSTEMFIADEGWLTQVGTINTVAGAQTVNLPTGIAMIKELRFLSGDTYIPIHYDDQSGQPSFQAGSGVVGLPASYRIINNQFYFDPPLQDGGTAYLMWEGMLYPASFTSDSDNLPSQFDKAMQHFIKYRAASVLSSSFGKANKEWGTLEAQWYEKVVTIITRRNLQTTTIREFEG